MRQLRFLSLATLLSLAGAPASLASVPTTEPMPELAVVRCDTIDDVQAAVNRASVEVDQPVLFYVSADAASGDQVLVIFTPDAESITQVSFRDGCAVATWQSSL